MIGRILAPLALTLITLDAGAWPLHPPSSAARPSRSTIARDVMPIDRVTQSPLKIAPPFRTLHKRYPIETLAESLAEGIQTGHPTMPEFQLDPDQIHDLLSYLKTLE